MRYLSVATKWAVGFLGTVALLGTGTHLYFRSNDDLAASRDLPEAIAEYRATELPWTAEDLDPHVLPEDNAAPLLQVAAWSLQRSAWDSRAVESALKTHNYSKAARLLKPIESDLGIATMAAAKPGLDFKLYSTQGADIPPVYDFARALGLRAQLEAAQGNSTGCARDLTTARRLGALMGQVSGNGPFEQVSIDQVTLADAKKVAALLSSDLKGLGAILKALKTPFTPPDFCRFLRQFAYDNLEVSRNPIFEEPAYANRQVDPVMLQHSGVPESMGDQASMDRVLRAWTRVGRVMRPNKDPIAVAREFESVRSELLTHDTSSYRTVNLMFKDHNEMVQNAQALVEDEPQLKATRAFVQTLIDNARAHRPRS